MIFSVDEASKSAEPVRESEFSELGILEENDIQEWAVDEPRLLGEELLVVSSEYSNFEETRDRLDILALDKDGKLVVVELKRDQADRTTDLQAIKYAGYCATLTAEDIQKEYRDFRNEREEKELSPEDVGEDFSEFLDDETVTTEDGWADFELDNKPRILLAAGRYGIEVTAPVMWLIEEYGMDITCTKLQAYEQDGRTLLNSQQVIPPAEAEDYMTRRREKQEEQEEKKDRRRAAIDVLLERGVLSPGEEVVFRQSKVPEGADREYDEEDEFWRAEITGNTGQSDNAEWLCDGELYSFTGLSKEILNRLVDRPYGKSLNGYKYWCHPELDEDLSTLRNTGVGTSKRIEED
jgi:hypothetical protein